VSEGVAIFYAGRAYEARAGESVLECLRRYGVAVSYSCRAGICQSCVLKVARGVAPSQGQAGLKPAWRAQGYVLACRTPSSPGLALEAVDAAPYLGACVEAVERLGTEVVRVWVRASGEFVWAAGQFVHVQRPDGLTRPYSVANVPRGGLMELHVAVRPGGRMSEWLASGAGVATQVSVRGPFGECFYVPGRPEQPLVLAATGTGLAPLLGVIRGAMKAGHSGPIWLYHGSRNVAGLYLWEELMAMTRVHPNLTVVGCVRENPQGWPGIRTERIEDSLERDHPKLAGARLFLCGNPQFVRLMRKRAYLAGVSLDAIHSDPFVEAERGSEQSLAVQSG
jgi:NAD(P)H-flavin reductase